MDPALSTQYPVHKIGSDGFSWWVGQIESGKNDDPKNSGRYRVRIVGTHLKDANSTPSDQLPWANVMLPATTPWSDGGKTGASIGLDIGNWVIGFFLDNDKQKPMIMGSIGHTAGATLLENVEEDPNPAGTEKSFTTYVDQNVNPGTHKPISDGEVRGREGEEDSGATGVADAGLIAAAVPDKMPPAFYALFKEASETNPTGKKVCVEVANPNCGSETNLESGLSKIISDLLKSNQDSSGNLGDFYVSKATGELNSYVQTGRTYINKAIKLVKSFIARLKGEIVKLLRDAVDQLVEAILYTEATTDALGNVNTGPINPDLGIEPFVPVEEKVSKLKPIIDTVNDILEEVGCSMENLTDQIAKFITDLLFGFLMDAYSSAACLVDTAVSGIINQIMSFIDGTLAQILGPLSEILGVVADPANLIGGIVDKAFSLLGISCDGPSSQCEKIQTVCTDSAGDENMDDWLDNLLNDIEDGPLDETQYVCDEAKQALNIPSTDIAFVGGIFEDSDSGGSSVSTVINPDSLTTANIIQYTSEDITVTEGDDAIFTITRSGNISVSSSIKVNILPQTAKLDKDFKKEFQGSVLGFGPYETTKVLKFSTLFDNFTTEGRQEGPETFRIVLKSRVIPDGFSTNFPNGFVFECTINNINSKSLVPEIPQDLLENPDLPPYTPPKSYTIPDVVFPQAPVDPVVKLPRYSVQAENPYYIEGQEVVFNIASINTNTGDEINYTLDVDPEDIVGGATSGTFTLDELGNGIVKFVLAENNDNVRIDPPGTVPLLDSNGEFILDSEGNVQFNTEEIITDISDDNETLTLTVTQTGDSGSTVILGENDDQPNYFVRSDQTSYNEGDVACFTITTVNVPDGTEGFYNIVGDILTEEGNSGKFVVNNERAKVCLNISTNDETQGARLVTFNVVDINDSILATENITVAADPVTEEEEDEILIPSYSVDTDKLEYTEGDVIQYTITTTNVPDGTALQYRLSGLGISPEDFVTGKLSGTFVVIDNQAKVFINIAEDAEIEQNENLLFSIIGTSGFATVVILAQLDEDNIPVDPRTPCLKKPIAGEPVTDSTGSIISIPIESKGCPYLEPPRVIIGGAGAGATAIPLLDNNGRVSEIRVTRVGAGYKINSSQDQNLKCVIDSFTILNPGRNYKEAPKVFVDGVPGIAEAIIDERGFVISVQILDRSLEITELSKVTFSGGGGFGARVLPSIVCLPSLDELAATGYAKIGTGRYIDCP